MRERDQNFLRISPLLFSGAHILAWVWKMERGEGPGPSMESAFEKNLSRTELGTKNRVLKQKMVYWAPPWLRPFELGRGQKWSLFSFTAQRRKTLIFEESEIRLNSSFFLTLNSRTFFGAVKIGADWIWHTQSVWDSFSGDIFRVDSPFSNGDLMRVNGE